MSLNDSRACLSRRVVGEFVGTAMLLVAVVGSGIMGARLSEGNDGIALLANSLATGAALVALILAFGPLSGAHFNPVVTLSDASQGGIAWRDVPGYIGAQIAGALAGVGVANLMFDLPAFAASMHERAGAGQLLGEIVATFGLVCTIWGCSRARSAAVPYAVGGYLLGTYWFTSSTSFANPAVTLARAATDTFSGIRPVDVPAFVVAQIAGGAGATLLFRWLIPALPVQAANAAVAELE